VASGHGSFASSSAKPSAPISASPAAKPWRHQTAVELLDQARQPPADRALGAAQRGVSGVERVQVDRRELARGVLQVRQVGQALVDEPLAGRQRQLAHPRPVRVLQRARMLAEQADPGLRDGALAPRERVEVEHVPVVRARRRVEQDATAALVQAEGEVRVLAAVAPDAGSKPPAASTASRDTLTLQVQNRFQS
jgi:hypothetical protein